ncbi:MAG: hypothetical protein JXO50_04380, partial [Deltaproteobacteria bacterium]|nr:hypothetical protein [Candidatus Anaeroferrophillus wilburensis]
MQTTESLFRFNRKMRMVALVVAVLSVAMGVMLWRHYQLKGLGQDSRYQAPMRHYSTGEKKMIRGNFDGALKEYQQAKSMLEEIPGIDLSQDFYYGIVLNGIGTIHLRVGIYGRETKPSAIKAGLDPDYEKIRESLAYFKSSERIYTTWLAGNRPTAAAITHLEDSRKGKKSEDIVLQPFERYERA